MARFVCLDPHAATKLGDSKAPTVQADSFEEAFEAVLGEKAPGVRMLSENTAEVGVLTIVRLDG
jgi:hypothetical protein